jgi:O-antigen/teichoic acid export membrane protein
MSDAEVRTARGAVSLYFASVFSLVLNTVYLVVLTNILPQSEVGVVALLNVLVIGIATCGAMAIPVVGAGLSATPPAVARFLSQYIRSGNGRAARRVLLVSFAFCTVISLALALLLTRMSVESFLSIPPAATEYAAIDGVFFALGQVGAYSLIGTESAGKAGVVLSISALVRYLASSLLLLSGAGAAGVFKGFIVGDLFLTVAGAYLANRGIPRTGNPTVDRSLYPYMLSVMLSGLIGFGVSQSDRLLAFVQTGLVNLSVYNIAAVAAAVAAFAPIAVTNALVPTIATLPGADAHRARISLMRDYTRYVSLVALPAGFGLAALSPLLLLIFGPQYEAGGSLVAVMAIAIGLTSISSVYASGLLASGKTPLFLLGNLLALVTLLVLAYLLVPAFGLIGIAYARAAMLAVSLLAFALFVRATGELVLDVTGYLKSLFSSLVMFAVVYGLVEVLSPHIGSRAEHVVFSLAMIPLGTVLYLLTMKLTAAFAQEDFDFLGRLLPAFLKPLAELLRRMFLGPRRNEAF